MSSSLISPYTSSRKMKVSKELDSSPMDLLRTSDSLPIPLRVNPRERKRRKVSTCISHNHHHVRFSTVDVYEIPREDEPHRFWYKNDELLDFKSSAKALSMEIAQNWNSEDYQSLYKRIIEAVYLDSSQGPPSRKPNLPEKALLARLTDSLSWRGLERWSVPVMGWHRSHQRNELIRNILWAQSTDTLEREVVLQQLSESFSYSAKRFARAMADVDAFAVMEDLDPPEERILSVS
jgi:hypothetical protein